MVKSPKWKNVRRKLDFSNKSHAMMESKEWKAADAAVAANTGVSSTIARKPAQNPFRTPASCHPSAATPDTIPAVQMNIKLTITCGPASRFPGSLNFRVCTRETTLLSLASRAKCLFAQDARDAWYLMGMRHGGKLHLIPSNAASAWRSPTLASLGVKNGNTMQLVMCRRSQERAQEGDSTACGSNARGAASVGRNTALGVASSQGVSSRTNRAATHGNDDAVGAKRKRTRVRFADDVDEKKSAGASCEKSDSSEDKSVRGPPASAALATEFLSRVAFDQEQDGQEVHLTTYLNVHGTSQADTSTGEVTETVDSVAATTAPAVPVCRVRRRRGARRNGAEPEPEHANTRSPGPNHKDRGEDASVAKKMRVASLSSTDESDAVTTAITTKTGLARLVSSVFGVFHRKEEE